MRSRQRGFTFIELAVVLFVIGLMVAVLLPRQSWIPQSPKVEEEALGLADTIELLRDEAALQGRNFGIRFEPDGFEVLDLDPDSGAWVTISDDEFYLPHEFEENILIALEIEEREIELEFVDDDDEANEQQLDAFGNPIETATQPPQLVVLTSGEVTPFQLTIEQFGTDARSVLIGDAFGALELETEEP